MNIFKSAAIHRKKPEQPNSGRRSFIWKVGAGISAVLSTAVPGIARTGTETDMNLRTKVNRLSNQVEHLESEKEIRILHQTYENLLNNGMYEEVESMFTDDAEVIFNGGVFRKKEGIRRLYCGYFSFGLTGKKMDAAPGFELDDEQHHDVVKVSGDFLSAEALFTYSIQVGSPMSSDSLLVKMARLQGGGVMKWWEGGTYGVSYKKEISSGSWKIKKLEYKALSRADYRPGRPYAKPISVPGFLKIYPQDPTGPDKLVTANNELLKG